MGGGQAGFGTLVEVTQVKAHSLPAARQGGSTGAAVLRAGHRSLTGDVTKPSAVPALKHGARGDRAKAQS